MLNVVLVDDEWTSLEQLDYGLRDRVAIAAKFDNPLEAVEKIREIRPAAVFLDVEMPGMDGFETANEILNYTPDTGIVFVTAHSELAFKAFEIAAVDYVVKPFLAERLAATVKRLERKWPPRAPGGNIPIKDAIHRQIVAQKPERICLWQNEKVVIVKTARIVCCYLPKMQRKVTVVVNNTRYQSSDGLNEFLEKIGAQCLLRCHRNFAINPQYLQELLPGDNKTMIVRLDGFDGEIPVSRQYSQTVRAAAGLHVRNLCME